MITCIIIIFLIFQNNIIACTVFAHSEDTKVLVGSNDDWYDHAFWIRFFPAEANKYGRVIFEFEWPLDFNSDWHSPQCGMNDKGLFYDCLATPELMPMDSQNKQYYYNNSDYYGISLESYCLSLCSTIDEVLNICDKYNLRSMQRYHVLWVDKTGSSIIIEGDDIIYEEGNFQVATNFLHSHPELGGYPCWRYDTAINMLENMNDLSIDYFTLICNATHQTGLYPSVYSTVYDLNEKNLYLYYLYNYETVVEINLDEELQLGKHIYYLDDLFNSSNNQPPKKPSTPNGRTSINKSENFTYTSITTDPNKDMVQYLFDWGDETNSGWIQSQNGKGQASHSWVRSGDFEIKVKARDIHHAESEWSKPLLVCLPKSKSFQFPFITYILHMIFS